MDIPLVNQSTPNPSMILPTEDAITWIRLYIQAFPEQLNGASETTLRYSILP